MANIIGVKEGPDFEATGAEFLGKRDAVLVTCET